MKIFCLNPEVGKAGGARQSFEELGINSVSSFEEIL